LPVDPRETFPKVPLSRVWPFSGLLGKLSLISGRPTGVATSGEDIVRGENDENAIRKDFLPSEIDSIRRALEPKEKEAAKDRQKEHGGAAPGKHLTALGGYEIQSRKVSLSEGQTRDKIGAFAGVSGRTVEKIKAVVEAAEENPEKFGHLVDEMDRTGKVGGAIIN
jgi:hypothetical protein